MSTDTTRAVLDHHMQARDAADLDAILEDYAPDCVFISGLFVYLTDEQAARLMANVRRLVKPGGTLVLRDGTSILPVRHQIVDRFSEILKAYYSAVYRTAPEYHALFADAGFTLVRDGQVFPEGCPLNKFAETRLRYYLFRPAA